MKRVTFAVMAVILVSFTIKAQDSKQAMEAAVSKLNNASTVADYQVLANDFNRIANAEKNDWLPYYYAAFCNAKIGWLYQEKTDNIEPFAKLSLEQAQRSLSLLDTGKQKKELSELYCVMSMGYRAYVFINPMSNGRKYGPPAGQYNEKAKQLDPANPRALYLEAWTKYYTPKAWGGDKKQARVLLDEAVKLLQQSPASSLSPSWGKKECEELLSNYKK